MMYPTVPNSSCAPVEGKDVRREDRLRQREHFLVDSIQELKREYTERCVPLCQELSDLRQSRDGQIMSSVLYVTPEQFDKLHYELDVRGNAHSYSIIVDWLNSRILWISRSPKLRS